MSVAPEIPVRSVLAEPLTLRSGATLPNRLMKAALSEALGSRTHGPSPELECLYARWAEGGFGLVVTGNVMVDRTQLGEPGNVVIEDERDLDGLRRWAATFARSGTPLWMQVNHPGRQANPMIGRTRPVAPSALAPGIPGTVRPRALTSVEIAGLVERYATAARVARDAGFDGVQIHGAHGYLVTQFLSPASNQRTDEWGGDGAGRRRFLLEVVRRTREQTGPGFTVAVKLNSADAQRGGYSLDEARETVAALSEAGVDLLEISGGTYENPAMMGIGAPQRESTRRREAYFLEFAAAVREDVGPMALAVTGGFRSHEAMAEAVASGVCDVVGLGRPPAVRPDAASVVLDDPAARLASPAITVGGRAVVRRFTDPHLLDGLLDLQWHTDQLALLGRGRETDPDRAWWRTAVSTVRRNGLGALKPRPRR